MLRLCLQMFIFSCFPRTSSSTRILKKIFRFFLAFNWRWLAHVVVDWTHMRRQNMKKEKTFSVVEVSFKNFLFARLEFHLRRGDKVWRSRDALQLFKATWCALEYFKWILSTVHKEKNKTWWNHLTGHFCNCWCLLYHHHRAHTINCVIFSCTKGLALKLINFLPKKCVSFHNPQRYSSYKNTRCC